MRPAGRRKVVVATKTRSSSGGGEIPYAALCDGAGAAEQAAKKVLTQLERLLKESTPEQIVGDATWAAWVRLLDSALLGGAQSTLVGVAVVGTEAVGACVGDSRAYLFTREGQARILTEAVAKARLGSGKAQAYPIRCTLRPGDLLVLLSDGAWTPLSTYALQKAVLAGVGRHLSETPQAILDAAARTGRRRDRHHTGAVQGIVPACGRR